jgi:uncharacterized protein YybS (DUF2232 family)
MLAGNAQATMIVAGVSFVGVFIAIATGHPDGMPIVVQNSGVAMLLSQAEQRCYSGPITFLVSMSFLCVSVVAGLVLLSGTDLTTAMNSITKGVADSIDKSFAEYMTATGETIPADMEVWFRGVKETVVEFFPGMIGCSLAAVAMSNVLLARLWISRRDGRDVLGPAFKQWRFPDFMVWIFIISGALIVSGVESAAHVGKNVMLVTGFCYLLQGISLIQYFFAVLKPPAYIRWITWLVLGLQWYGLLLVAALGIAYTWFDIRGYIDRKYGDEQDKRDLTA